MNDQKNTFQQSSVDSSVNLKTPLRPWDLLNKSETRLDFSEAPSQSKFEKNENSDSLESGTVSKQKTTWFMLFKENQKQLALSFVLFATLFVAYAATIPTSFYSTLHLFAPEKTDSIGTRLSLFTQKLEFASFPVDYKTPISLISRRLREDAAKDYVIKKIEADPENKALLNRASVSIDTNYVPNQEILALEGYANTPELAVLVTNFYWDFLTQDLKAIEKEQQTKIRKWFDLTNSSIEKQIAETMNDLQGIAPKTFEKSAVFKLQESLGDVFSDLELKKSTLEKQLTELKSLRTNTDFIGLTESLDSEVASQLKIYNQLYEQKNLVSAQRLAEGRISINDTINRRIQEVQYDLNNILSGQRTAQGQMVNINSKNNQINVASEQEMDLRSQMITLRNQKSDLIKFKSQIEMESSIRSSHFIEIRAATPNPSSIRPLPAVKYSLALFIAMLLSITTVLSYRLFIQTSKK